MPFPFDPAQPTLARQILEDLGASPNRTLGQNFLTSPVHLDRIADAAKLEKSDSVLEIGPGLGALTVRLLERAKFVAAIEKDRKFAAYLIEKWPALHLIEGDALDIDWPDLNLPDGAKLVANLPYSISKPILRRIFEDFRPHLSTATVLVQREVAQRILAAPATGEWGPMGIMAQLWGAPKKCFDIAPGAFLPPPNVVSTVVHIQLRQTPSVEIADEKAFWRIVRAAFGQRRKQLGNTLKTIAEPEKLGAAFEKLSLDPKRRGETLSLQEFADLASTLSDSVPGELQKN